MNITEVCNAFDMSVERFARLIGYRRPTLYNGIHWTPKARRAIDTLRRVSAEMYERDKAEAKVKYEAREDAINSFIDQIKPHRRKKDG